MTWWNPSKPDEIKPSVWMHPAAVLYLESLLQPEMNVIEHGCGGSTLWLAERVRFVRSFDDNEEWVSQVQVPKNAKVVYYSDVPYIAEKADLLFIDGRNEKRPLWLKEAKNMVRAGGIIVLDNSNRDHYQSAVAELLAHCHAPTTIGAWTDYGKFVETAFFRLKGWKNWI